MKKQIAKTISILSLFVVLSVSASNVSAFPKCPTGCQPAVRYVASAPAQTANLATVQAASSVAEQPDGLSQLIALFWLPVAGFFASLL